MRNEFMKEIRNLAPARLYVRVKALHVLMKVSKVLMKASKVLIMKTSKVLMKKMKDWSDKQYEDCHGAL